VRRAILKDILSFKGDKKPIVNDLSRGREGRRLRSNGRRKVKNGRWEQSTTDTNQKRRYLRENFLEETREKARASQ